MQDICELLVTGRIGQGFDSEKFKLEYTATGMASCRSSVAVSKSRKVDDAWVNETMWINLQFFGALAETFSQKFEKGAYVMVRGRWDESKYVDKKTGEQKTSHKLIVSQIQRVPVRKEQSATTDNIDPDVSDVLDNVAAETTTATVAPPPPPKGRSRAASSKAGVVDSSIEEETVPF
jgi:single stranded DNA-binding protein